MGSIFLSLLLAVGVSLIFFRSRFMDNKGNFSVGGLISTTVMLFIPIFAGSLLWGSWTIVSPGERGVVVRLGEVKQRALNEGLNFIVPVIDSVEKVDVRVVKGEAEATAASRDLQIVHTKVAINFHQTPEATPHIYQIYGRDVVDKVIVPAVQESVKATTARFTAEELITKREIVKEGIKELIVKHGGVANIIIDEVYITDFNFSEGFNRAIEEKQTATQQALKAERDLTRIKIEAEQKVASARAEAESLRMQQNVITPDLIRLRQVEVQKLAIEKWNGQMPSVIMGGQATPLLDLSTLSKH